MGLPFRHDAALYRTDEEYLGVVVPFLREGLDAGVPTLLCAAEERARLLRDVLGDPEGLTVLDAPETLHPYRAAQDDHDTFDGHLADAAMVHVVSDVRVDATTWEDWARYEAVRNHLHRERPVRLLCPFDVRGVADSVLDDVGRTHPWLLDGEGTRTASTGYADPAEFLAERARAEHDPLESGAPALDLADPTPARCRGALTAIGAPENLVYAASEVVTNALQHGLPPVRMRAWAAPDRVVVAVHDAGPGPADPFVGLLPSGRRALQAGMGLWMAYRMCDRVSIDPGPDGCTVRLTCSF